MALRSERARLSSLGLILACLLILGVFACGLIPGAKSGPSELPTATAPGLALPATLPPPSATPPPPTPTASPSPTATPTPTATPLPLRFAVVGDYGTGGQPAADVAALIQSWNPEFILTVGDNNYPAGAAETLDRAVGQFYHSFIAPYYGGYGPGSDVNRFFPTLGNHDWMEPGAQPYLDYFTLPGNERYYDFTWGPVHLFALDSASNEPDGVRADSRQAAWLREQLAGSTSTWKIVYFHHAPFSSGTHGGVTWMDWPFREWGADLVLSGHDHTYERLEVGGLPYIVNGLGGGGIYDFRARLPGSLVRFNADYGAILVEATETSLVIQFITRQGEVVDVYTLAPRSEYRLPRDLVCLWQCLLTSPHLRDNTSC